MKYCDKCKKNYPDDSLFCSECGSTLKDHRAASNNTGNIICSGCGATNKDTYHFCGWCGQKLESAVVQGQTQPCNTPSNYQITFMRPDAFQMMGNLFHIKVDNSVSYELKNGGETRITMSAGQHTIELSVFGMPKKKQFSLQVTGNMTLICKPNPSASVTLWASPVKVTDSSGREY